MSRRLLAALVAALAAVSGIAVGAISSPPIAAAGIPLALEMVPGSGELLVREAEDTFPLESPTTVTGTIDDGTGVISGATLSTPQISFEYPVLNGAVVANIDVTFTQVTPTTGQLIGPDGDLVLQTALRAAIHVEVPSFGLTGDCIASPVQLELSSVAPYSPTTRRVTVSDTDFTIPPVPQSAQCMDPVLTNLNDALAGAGHSLALTLEGDMTVPQGGDEPSDTGLTVTPDGGAALGQEVTFTAAVDAGATAESTETPTGFVRFMDGDDVMGQEALVDGVATFTTTTLGLGDRTFTARYVGDSVYLPSESAGVAYTVSATPSVDVEVPEFVTIGTDPAAFDLVIENPSLGAAVANARVDVTISRFTVDGYSFDALQPDDVLLEVETASNVWTPVTLTQVGGTATPTLSGALPPALGRSLPAGASFADHLRISFPDGEPQTTPGPLDVEFSVVDVDPASGAVDVELSSTTGRLNLFLPGRVETEVRFSHPDEPYGPPVVRQRGTLTVQSVTVTPYFGATRATGTFTTLIDGQRVPAFGAQDGDLTQPSPERVVVVPSCGCNSLFIDLPPNVGIGDHHLTIVYSGDDQFAPSQTTVPFSVVAAVSDPYSCEVDQFGFYQRFNVQLRAHARVPRSSIAGSNVLLRDFSFEIVANRTSVDFTTFDLFVGGQVAAFGGLTIDLGPDGSGSATAGALDPVSYPNAPEDADDPDFNVRFVDETASLSVTGPPGTVITPSIEGFTLDADFFGTPLKMTCEAVGDPVTFASTTVAGTVLTVDAPAPVREDHEIDLTANVYPATGTGTVQFFDGDALLDIASVRAGVATTSVSLPAGAHSLTARFRAGATAPSTTSEPVEIEVRPAVECPSTADAGNGAAVRLVYLELLERCPETAGYEYWTNRLDEGSVTREQFARQISASFEARGVLVNDAYLLMLGRPAEAGGRSFWAARLATTRYDRLLAELAASPEFWTLAGGTPEGFVERVYERLLHRAPEPAGLAYWSDRLEAGGSRGELVITLVNLTEPLQAVVRDAYEDILGRSPRSGELSADVARLRRTGSRSLLFGSLIGTDDFFTRAQSLPNPED